MATDTPRTSNDQRTNQEVMTQWRKLQELKRAMVREGKCSGDANATSVLAAVRAEVPANLF